MSRSKKTRNINENGAKMAPRTKKSDRKIASKKRDNGNKTGSRSNEGALKQASSGNGKTQAKDPRHGSKRPIVLTLPEQIKPVVTEKAAKPKQPKITDEQRLLMLEEDPRLNELLDMLEEGRNLAPADQKWLDKQLAEIEKLMEKLGLAEEEDFAPSKPKSDDDLLDQFESGMDLLKQYQNKD
ncbi:Der GTPase-activating protein YihI [Shewanella submarina]|uniref:Der GTPase-activating protein YihI n=1 Tax=Shewanella submarina TaxID=2016376 RepID=A0ABV7GFP7_9GAMM|nr:Der GTPase-activating protein YihI [Shewanella submarina]MCL1038761.1 Der GTPase-activating protein YihI [Shewanella submarina]